ncbi:MAG: ATP-grasp domain-containing protein [Deltaproteobacteria bacterium]|nr:ATP-grasp domain-containing protein [Deltaproteobacteria bacterium]MBI3293445.1 ATP-grasp domain-containing protein [Deltaproteobacteria bacterium]
MKIAFVFNRKTNDSLEQAEFDTPETVASIHVALASGGHEVLDVEMTLDSSAFGWAKKLAEFRPDMIFNTAEGYYGIGRESLGPTVFEQLQLPYVGSGPYGCFLTLDKFLTKQMVTSRKVPTVEGYFITTPEDITSIAPEVSYPTFVKPNYEGSSKGITAKSVCRDPEELTQYATELLKTFSQGVLVERYIPGRDVSVPFITGLGDGGVLEPLEYVFNNDGADGIYDYDLKNLLDDKVSVRCPAQIEPHIRAQLIAMMKRIIPAVGVVDFARADFRITPDGEVYFLEINALPSLQPGAGVFEAARLLGLDFNQTILKILDAAVSRIKPGFKSSKSPRRLATRNPRVALVYNLKRKELSDPEYEIEAEFDSQNTVDTLRNALEKITPVVIPVEATRTLSEGLLENRIDIVFNIAEGSRKRAREAQVPAICDLLEIEHTGSDATCLAITLDKAITKRLLTNDGILTPNFRLYHGSSRLSDPGLRFPVMVKPNSEGTSKGIGDKSVVNNQDELQEAVLSLWKKFQTPVLCEEYIEGREFTIGILGNTALKLLGPMEISFTDQAGKYPVYSFEAKQNPENPFCSYVCPVSISKDIDRRIANFAKKVFRSLGCRDVSRIDFRLDSKGNIYFLEINPLPGLAPGFSDLVIMAEKQGMSYDALIKRIFTPAVQRWRSQTKVKTW